MLTVANGICFSDNLKKIGKKHDGHDLNAFLSFGRLFERCYLTELEA